MNLTGIHGVIFDLDGTLVDSQLDFTHLRDAVGCPQHEDILAYVDALTCATTRQQAMQLIVQHELQDAYASRWLANGKTMVDRVQAAQLPMAIVTRNSRQATAVKIKNNAIPITTVLTREDAPPKPDPTALLQIAKQWALAPKQCLYVGDYIYDRHAAENAGMQWLLV